MKKFVQNNLFFIAVFLIFVFLALIFFSWSKQRVLDIQSYALVQDGELEYYVDQCEIDKSGLLKIKGWAFLKSAPGQGDLLITHEDAGNNKILPSYRRMRDDVLNYFNFPIKPLTFVGFEASGFLPGKTGVNINILYENRILRRAENVCEKY